MNQEQIYDQQIAPLMSQIIEICKTNEINLHAYFFLRNIPEDIDPIDKADFIRGIAMEDCKNVGVTTHLPFSPPAEIRMLLYLSEAKGNLDAFLFQVIADARERGHSSVFLRQLMIPEEPDA